MTDDEAMQALMRGDHVDYGGEKWKVGGVQSAGGERRYFLVLNGDVALVPAESFGAWTDVIGRAVVGEVGR